MKYSLLITVLLSGSALLAAPNTKTMQTVQEPVIVTSIPVVVPAKTQQHTCPQVQSIDKEEEKKEVLLEKDENLIISVLGQGVAPMNTYSPAQAFALAKRAAVADAYRLVAEKVKGVRIDGQDLIKNMMVKRSTIRTSVQAMVRNANIVETTFKEGLCEVEMEILISHSQFQ